MSNQKVLEKAIRKAIYGGWKTEALIPWRDGYGVQKLKSRESLKEFDVEHIIFNHDFAKALWGDEPVRNWTLKSNGELDKPAAFPVPMWKIRLQAMVVADDPVKYIGDSRLV